MIVFTSICCNYGHKARTLAESVKKNIPDAKFYVCLTEREIPKEMEYTYFDKVILSKDMWEGNFDQFIFKHAIVEASTAVKGQFFRYLMDNNPDEDMFVYLDPDCYVYSDFTELKETLKKRPIVLCPHLLQPGNIDMELSSTAHGVYNLGFLGVNHSDEARKFIDWWAERLSMFCYDDIQRGIFTDQKWIDLAPCFFDVEVFKHKGYDFATWSLLDCGMTKENDSFFVKGDPLRFIHFSGYGATIEKCMNLWLPEGEHPFRELYKKYSEIHDFNNKDNISKYEWTYSKYKSGKKISDATRIEYRNSNKRNEIRDPFSMSDREISKFLRGANNNSNINKAIKYYQQNGFLNTIKKIYSIFVD